ncbi:DUF6612 family protein [Tumebacillus permanentifrigoris]|uniref:S-layer family protein n=1 Tax=Tumebacillus permanentifrigoris TaxID=378543 RepID=A0A316D432_9BACL|nr:DUF6612 family protein [Tumebacillus permanentifrigoris]PWK05960.1 S-layer family protein [Tumebacillus permanentifrigoris]
MKRTLFPLLLSGLLATSLCVPATTAHAQGRNLTDLGNSYAQIEIQALIDQNIISGYEDNTFRPSASMTRQEFATLLAKALKLTPDSTAAAKFTDVEDWARPYVGALVSANLTSGTGTTTFGALEPISREQLATFFIRAMGKSEEANTYALTSSFADEGQTSDYAKPLVALTQHIGFIKGSQGTSGWIFDPQGNAERQAVARLAYEFSTHGTTYTGKADQIGRVIALLDQTDAAMNSLASFHATERMTASPDLVVAAEVDFTRSPFTAHETSTVTGTDVDGQALNVQSESYVADGTAYMQSPDKTWGKMAFQGSLDDLVPSHNTSTKEYHAIAPYLTVTEDATTYTLSGTVPSVVLNKVVAAPDASTPDVQFQSAAYSFVLDKTTHYQVKSHTETALTTGEKSTFDMTLTNFNGVQPITVPDEIKTNATAM